jgi:hypothetical protein
MLAMVSAGYSLSFLPQSAEFCHVAEELVGCEHNDSALRFSALNVKFGFYHLQQLRVVDAQVHGVLYAICYFSPPH